MITPLDAYRELLTATPHATGRAFRAFKAADGVILRAWVDGVSRLPGLTVIVRGTASLGLIPQIRGLEVADLIDRDGGSAELGISCTGSDYAEVFIELASRLVERAQSEPTGDLAQKQIVNQLNLWARFFESAPSSGLSRSVQLGLIGELLCLRELAVQMGLPRAVDAWRGPYGAAHDFQWSGRALEAKLTTSASPEKVTITSERQLESPPNTVLLLGVTLALETASEGVTLVELVAELSARLAAEPRSLKALEDALAAVGFLDERSVVEPVRVSIRQTALLEVTDAFPKITSRDVMKGVYNVSYSLPWSAIAGFEIEPLRKAELIA